MNLDQYLIDLTTERVNPNNPAQVRKGEAPRTAFTKINYFMTEVIGYLWHIDVLPPNDPIAYMTWLDTSVDPAMIRRRNKDNTDWITIGPALDVTGTSLFANLTSASPDADKLEARNILQLGVFATLNDESTPEQVNAARNLLGEFGPVFPADTKIYGVQNKQPVELNVYSRLTDTSPDADRTRARLLMGLGSAAEADYGSLLSKAGNLNGIESPEIARGNLGLGSASTLNVPAGQTGFGNASAATLTVSTTDNTPGRVLRVGDAGLAAAALPFPSDLFSDATNEFARSISTTTANTPSGESYGAVQTVTAGGSSYNVNKWLFKMIHGSGGSLHRAYKINALPWQGPFELFDTRNCVVTQNANGKSIRYPNGVQECFFRMQRSAVAINAALTGGGFRSAGQAWTFPQAFWELGCCSAGITVNNEGIDAIPQFVSLTSSTFVLKTANSAIASSPSLVVEVRAIGLWKQPS